MTCRAGARAVGRRWPTPSPCARPTRPGAGLPCLGTSTRPGAGLPCLVLPGLLHGLPGLLRLCLHVVLVPSGLRDVLLGRDRLEDRVLEGHRQLDVVDLQRVHLRVQLLREGLGQLPLHHLLVYSRGFGFGLTGPGPGSGSGVGSVVLSGSDAGGP